MNIIFYVIHCIFFVVKLILYPFIFYIPKSSRKSVSTPTDDLLKISATKLAELIRQKKISSEEIITAYIKRIKEVNPSLHAVVDDRFIEALKDAKSVDNYLRTTSLTENELQKIKPLLGVPITIKESCMLSGMSFAVGSLLRQGIKAETDGEAVNRIKMSGAIPLLVSATPELCTSLDCSNYITGKTCNPYDITTNSGGSSGGEAALLGAGASLIGIGSDLAGSIRFPAMSCGVFGHKPSPRTVPIKGHYPLPNDKKIFEYLKIGPMTRYAEDLKILLTVLCGKQSIELKLHQKVDMKKIRIHCMEEVSSSIIFPKVDIHIKEAVREAAVYLGKQCGSKIVENHDFAKLFGMCFEFSIGSLIKIEGVPNLLKSKDQSLPAEIIKALSGNSNLTFGYLNTLLLTSCNFLYNRTHEKTKEDVKTKMMGLLQNDGVLLCPTYPSGSVKHGEILFMLGECVYLLPLNVLGFPATTVPCGKNADGLPIGIQVIAAPNQDRLCLAVAEELEKCFGGWIPPTRL